MPRADESAANPLLAKLRARIARDGPLPVDVFMGACLADPEHGYWRRKDVIGASGDFVTAPEISQVFGELIGLWCAVVWQAMGQPVPVRLIELGPGRGTLMRDALRAAKVAPPFLAALSVHLIEISAPLREAQRQTLGLALPVLSSPPHHAEGAPSTRRGEGSAAAFEVLPSPPPLPSPTRGEGAPPSGRHNVGVSWHEAIEQVPAGPAIIIANEFLDALPVRQLVFADDGWRERVVNVDAEGSLCFGVGGKLEAGVPEPAPRRPQAGDILELRPAEDELLAKLARREGQFAALFVDYGPGEPAYGDTLQAVRRHAWVDPLADPGDADLTAHVQFAQFARKAVSQDLAVDGPMPQAEFLGRLGIAQRAARLMAANEGQAAGIEAGVQRLLSPTGMGTLFKAMVVRSQGLPALPPFV